MLPLNSVSRSLWGLLLAAILIPGPAVAGDGTGSPTKPLRVVYQCSEPGPGAYSQLLFSVDQLQQKYEEKIHIVVTCLGPGIHLLAKNPKREVPPGALDKLEYLSLAGVEFHACGNTMDALGWTANDMHEFVTVVPIGADDLMLLQLQGYAYLKW